MKQNSTRWIIRISALGLLAGMGCTPALWGFSDRSGFPLLPLFGDAVQSNGVLWLGILAFASVLAVAVFPEKKILSALAVSLELLLCALDLNRLQPWVWCYLLVFGAGIAQGDNASFRYLLAGMYCWSGFNKLTPYFAEDNFSWFCEAFSFSKSLGTFPILGYGLAFLEMALGIGLLWSKTQQIARWGLIGLHLIITVFLLQLNWNTVVIPWNLALAGMVWLATETDSNTATPFKRSLLSTKLLIPFVFSWFCPLLYFFTPWPLNLSWRLYSNTQPEATFFAEGNNMPKNSDLYNIWEKHAFENGHMLLLDDWAIEAINVPMFAADHTFQQMRKYLCSQSSGEKGAQGLYILRVNPWNKAGEQLQKIDCN